MASSGLHPCFDPDALDPCTRPPKGCFPHGGLLRRAEGQPQLGTLQLQVRPAFKRLPRAEQQRHAELWQGWAQELGYDHLELRDGLGALLARDALVGSGMIVLSSQPA